MNQLRVSNQREVLITCSFHDYLTTFKSKKCLAIACSLSKYGKIETKHWENSSSQFNYNVNGAVKEGISLA